VTRGLSGRNLSAMTTHLNIRPATSADATALDFLAAGAGRPPLTGPALLATDRDVPVGAVAVTSGAAIVDPVRAPAGTVKELRLRRYQLLRQGGHAGPAWALLA
jgi:hypothetical protein